MEEVLKEFQEAKKEQEINYSNPNYVFAESRRYIEASMGIELTLIELVRLKELAVDSIDRNSKVKGHWSKANLLMMLLKFFYMIIMEFHLLQHLQQENLMNGGAEDKNL